MRDTAKITIGGKARSGLSAMLALGAVALMLSGCVVYPSNGYYGGGGGYYAHSRYGGAGLGGVLGTVLIILLIVWLVGGVGYYR